MHLKEVISDRFYACLLKGCTDSVHTNTGDVGRVEATSFLKGTVTVHTNSGKNETLPARKVAPLDTIIT